MLAFAPAVDLDTALDLFVQVRNHSIRGAGLSQVLSQSAQPPRAGAPMPRLTCPSAAQPIQKRTAWRVFAAVSLAIALSACGSDADPDCRVGADCASGICNSDGTCAATKDASGGDGSAAFDVAGADGQTKDTLAADSIGGTDTSASQDGAANPDTANPDTAGPDVSSVDSGTTDASVTDTPSNPGVCTPNHDGTVSRSEVALAAGLSAPFLVAKDVTVDLVGSQDADGKPVWDFAKGFAGDTPSKVNTLDVKTLWFGKYFPDATYAVRLSDSSDLIGVFKLTDDALVLLGAASEKDSLLATRVSYDPPVPTLKFPMTQTTQWTAKSTASGTLNGVITAWTEQIDMKVSAYGILKTPMGNFPVLRVEAKTDKILGLFTTTYRSVAFLAECFGVVGKADSAANETQALFTKATEVRRIAP
jgi:hypothetical protein